MKKILPLLLCYVLSSAQVFAEGGGPVYGNGSITVTGTYAGVIQGITETDDATTSGPAIPGDPLPTPNTSNTTPSNAIGLFDLSVPTTDLATGAFMLFADGVIFSGTINGAADPDTDQLTGLLDGTYNFTLTTFDDTGATTATSVTATAVGRINAKIGANTTAAQVSTARLTGTADLEVGFGEYNTSTLAPIVARTITFDVIGYQQSQAATT